MIRSVLILAMVLFATVAQAAPPIKCRPELLPELIARVSYTNFTTQFTAEQIAEATWNDLGELRRLARDRNNLGISSYLTNREGAYDWINTQAVAAEVEPYLFVGRLIDCAMRLEANKAIHRKKNRGTAHEFLELAKTGKPDSDWLVKSIRRNIEEVRKARSE